MLHLQGVHAGYLGCSIVQNIELEVRPGTFFALIGPNGSGKSTLLQTISGKISPYKGRVTLFGKDLKSYSIKRRAQLIAVLDQLSNEHSELTVLERVGLGRLPHQSTLFPTESIRDREIIQHQIRTNKIEIYSNQLISRLSGGEQQRVRLAKTFTQQTPLILLDEPTNHLDMQHTIELLQSLKQLQKKINLTIIAVLHDINLAARYADELAIMNHGKIVKQGSPLSCLDEGIIREVFQIDMHRILHPTLQCPQFLLK
jgi:iron complex transport system ATP-binding protein